MKARCKKSRCKFAPWRQGFRYLHWRESRGFVFDLARKIFVRAIEAR